MPRDRPGRLDGGPLYLTTTKAARLLGVSAPTVAKWVDQGLLSAIRTPGGHRRILAADAARLARERGLEAGVTRVPGLLPGIVLVVDPSPDVADTVQALVSSRSRIPVRVVHDAFSAGIIAGRERVAMVIIDPTMPDLDPFAALPLLNEVVGRGVPVLGLVAVVDRDVRALEQTGLLHAVLQKPYGLSRLWDVAQDVLERLSG